MLEALQGSPELEAAQRFDHSFSVQSQFSTSSSPISCGAYGHEAVVRLLLATGQVDANSKERLWGQTPLSWAVEHGHEAVVRLIQQAKGSSRPPTPPTTNMST